MANLLYQQIEMLSREKHIEPDVVISAIEDAMVVAARKFYKSEKMQTPKSAPNTRPPRLLTFSVVSLLRPPSR